MPFVLRDRWNVYKNVVTRRESEVEWSFDDQMHNFRRKQDTRRNVGLSAVRSHPNESQHSLDDEDESRQDKPLPKVGTVKGDKKPKRNVKQMCPVEDFKASTATNEWQGTNEHDHKNDDQQEAGGVGPSANQPEVARTRREQKFVEREVLGVDDWIVDGVAGKVDDVHEGVDASKSDDQPSSQLVQVYVLIERQNGPKPACSKKRQ